LNDLPPGVRVFGIPEPQLRREALEQVAWKVYRFVRPIPRQVPTHDTILSNARPKVFEARRNGRWPPRSLGDLKRAYYASLDFARFGGWARAAAGVGISIVRHGGHSLIISCGPPHMAHEAARLVAHQTGVPFVVDMRDPWSLVQRLADTFASDLWLQIANQHEKKVVRDASLIVCNTEPACLETQRKYPEAASRIFTVMNGFDDEPVPESRIGSCFALAYAGTVYLDRNPGSLFQAIARLVRERNLQPAQLSVEFIGDANPGPIRELAASEGLESFVRTLPPMKRPELFRALAEAAVLVSLPQDSDMAIPSKVFEYLKFDAWVLALAKQGSATEMALHGTGADVVDPEQVDDLHALLRKRYDQFANGIRPQALAHDQRLSRRFQAAILFDRLENCLGKAQARTT
jgi:hypothetical protein